MKTRTMKKALSLILAVLMIALAIPFTLLPAAAEEFSGDDFAKVTLYAQKANGSSVGFSDRAGMAIDKILHEEESYASAGGNNTTIATTNNCLFLTKILNISFNVILFSFGSTSNSSFDNINLFCLLS